MTEDEIFVHVPGFGNVPAKRAMDLVPGDLTLWSHGAVSEVVSIEPTDSKSLAITLKGWNGRLEKFIEYDVVMRRGRPVAIAPKGTSNKGTNLLDLKPLIEAAEKGLEKIRKHIPTEEMLFDF